MTDRILHLHASARVEAAAASPKRGQFSGTAYAGGILRNSSWPAPVVVDLAGLAIADNLPLVVDHSTRLDARLGSAKATIERGTIYVEGRIVEGASPAADRVLALAAAGEPVSLSVGVNPARVERVPAGRSVSVNSQTFTGPIDVIRAGKLTEISVVGIGADAEASARVAAQKQGIPAMSQEVESMEVSPAPEGGTADAAHADRVDRILRDYPVLRAKAHAESWSLNQCADEVRRETALADLRASRPNVTGSIRTGGAPEGRLVAEAALAQICGFDNAAAEKVFGERTMQAARDSGVRSLRGWNDYCSQLDPTGAPRLTASFSTASLAVLQSAIPKILRAQLDQEPASVDGLADWRPLNDFRETSLYRLVVRGGLEEVGADGEIKHGSLQEASSPVRLATFARLFAITRQHLINDTIDALQQIPRVLASEASRLRADLFTELVEANPNSFFSAGNNNYIEGVNTALGSVGLAVAVATMREQTDEDGRVLGLKPAAIVVPAALESVARQLVASLYIQLTSDAEGPTGNWARDLNLTVVVEPRLADPAEWYLCAAPSSCPVVVGTLGGKREPTIEFPDTPANLLGVTVRGYYDVAVGLCEPRAWVRAKGTA